jgi:hypothetical protein
MSHPRKAVVGLLAILELAISAPASLATGGPNTSGSSGHFNPNSNPCQGSSDQPNCPGPH